MLRWRHHDSYTALGYKILPGEGRFRVYTTMPTNAELKAAKSEDSDDDDYWATRDRHGEKIMWAIGVGDTIEEAKGIAEAHDVKVMERNPKPKRKRKAKKKVAAKPKKKSAAVPSPRDFNVYITFVLYAVFGRIPQADTVMRKHGASVRKVAAWLRRQHEPQLKTLFRGILLEPEEVKDGTVDRNPAFTFVSLSEDMEVACWFADRTSEISGAVAAARPRTRGYLIELRDPPLKDVLFHHSWGPLLPMPEGYVDLRLAAARHPEIREEAGQVAWNLATQQEVLTTNRRESYPVTPYEDTDCPPPGSLDDRLSPVGVTPARWRDTIMGNPKAANMHPDNLISVRIKPEVRKKVLPKYVYYVLANHFSTGEFKRLARGSAQQCIRVSDVRAIEVFQGVSLGDIAKVTSGGNDPQVDDILLQRVSGNVARCGHPWFVKGTDPLVLTIALESNPIPGMPGGSINACIKRMRFRRDVVNAGALCAYLAQHAGESMTPDRAVKAIKRGRKADAQKKRSQNVINKYLRGL